MSGTIKQVETATDERGRRGVETMCPICSHRWVAGPKAIGKKRGCPLCRSQSVLAPAPQKDAEAKPELRAVLTLWAYRVGTVLLVVATLAGLVAMLFVEPKLDL